MDGEHLGVVNVEEVHQASQAPSLTTADSGRRPDAKRPSAPNSRRHSGSSPWNFLWKMTCWRYPSSNDLANDEVIGMGRRFDIASAYLQRIHGPSVPRLTEGQCHVR